jgi:hypothetical protein
MPDDDRDLSAEERRELEQLPREADPPADLEERIVAELRTRGHLRAPRSGRGPGLAAAAGLFAAGLGLGAAGGGWIGPAPSPEAPERGSLFLLLLYEGPGDEDGPGAEAKRVAEYGAWARELRGAGHLEGAEKLESRARLLGEGPPGASPTEPRGYFLLRATSLDEAIALARGCPHLRHGGRVAVHAVAPT